MQLNPSLDRYLTLLVFILITIISSACTEDSNTPENNITPTYTFETTEQLTAIKVELKQVGSPVWKPTEFRRFTAEIGDASNDFNKLMDVVHCYSSANNPGKNFFSDLNVYIPERDHPATFFGFVSHSMESCGFKDEINFKSEDFLAPKSINYVFQLVPIEGLAPVGKSPHGGDNQLIIPNAKFPISFNGSLFKEGIEIDSNFDGTLQPLNTLKFRDTNESIPGDGYQHIPMLLGDAYDFVKEKMDANGLQLTGEYVFTVDLIDAEQAGWTITMKYTLE